MTDHRPSTHPNLPPVKKPDSPETAQSTADWQEHEHVAALLQAQAQKLLDEAGSPELAKHAVDEVAQQRNLHEGDRESLAQQWGFASWDEMTTLSTSLAAADGAQWWITPRGQQGWIVWSQREWQAPTLFNSFEEAHRHFLHNSAAANSPGRKN